MSEWQPAETAPKDRCILVWGKPDDDDERGVRFLAPGVHTAYWDSIDSRFCIKGASWTGPFIEPLCWMDEPPPPKLKFDMGAQRESFSRHNISTGDPRID